MRKKLLVILLLLSMLISLVGCSLFGTVQHVDPLTDINSSYISQLNPVDVDADSNIIMADETVSMEFDGVTWTELRKKYGLDVPLEQTSTLQRPIEQVEVEQLDTTGYLQTMAIEIPMLADNGKEYILLKGQWYLYDDAYGVSAFINDKSGTLNFRTGPSVKNTIITSYKSATPIRVYKAAHMSDNSTWYYVKQENGDMGWQHSYYINIDENAITKPSTADLVGIVKPTEETETVININHDRSGRLYTRSYTEVQPEFLTDENLFIAPTRLWCYDGAGYTNERIMAVEAGTPMYILGKAEMSNGLTWYRTKWFMDVDVIATDETLAILEQQRQEQLEALKAKQNTHDVVKYTPTILDKEDLTVAFNKLIKLQDTEAERELVVTDLLNQMNYFWPDAGYDKNLKDAGDKKVFVMLEADTEQINDGLELRDAWINRLKNIVQSENIAAYNVYAIQRLNGDFDRYETKVCLVLSLGETKTIDETQIELPPIEIREDGMITIKKEYIGYIDYNIEKFYNTEQLMAMYGLTPTPTITSTPTPTAAVTVTPVPTSKPSNIGDTDKYITPTPKPTTTSKPTATPKPTATTKPTATPTSKPTATPTPTVEKGMALVPYNANDIYAAKTLNIKTVEQAFKKAGFSNIKKQAVLYDPNIGQPEGTVFEVLVANTFNYRKDDAFYKDALVLISYYTRKPSPTSSPIVSPTPTEMPLDPNVCKSPYSSSAFTDTTGNTHYLENVEKAYKDAGFTNVNIFADPYNPQIGQPEGLVYRVEIGGSHNFTVDTTYYKDTVVNIHYYTRKGISGTGNQSSDDVAKVSSPLASSVFTDDSNASQYLLNTTLNMYAKAGFTNISSVPVYYDVIIGQPEGMVKFIEIAGSGSYELSDKFYKDAEVVIYYYTRRAIAPVSSEECTSLSIGQIVNLFTSYGLSKKNVLIYGANIAENPSLLAEYSKLRVSYLHIEYETVQNNNKIIEQITDFKKDWLLPYSAKLVLFPDIPQD